MGAGTRTPAPNSVIDGERMEQLRTEDVCRYVGRLYLTSSQELDRVCAAYEVQIRQLKE